MAEEMMLENVPWESDEAEDWEFDETLAEADESAEDIGERARRHWRRRSQYRPGRGVRGITLRGPDGQVRNVPFPTKLATAAETNRGLANQEAARRALEDRMDRQEARFRLEQKNDSSVSGIVTLLIGGGLTAWAVVEASRQAGSRFGNWASQEGAKMAALISASQIATSGAKLTINGRYHRSGFGIAADAFAGAQLAAFAFGSLYKAKATRTAANRAALQALQAGGNLSLEHRYVTLDDGLEYETFVDEQKQPAFRLVR
jgi:hypothetical protein